MSRNLAASIRSRLKQRSDTAKQDFNLTLTHYGLERLRDADLLGFGPDDIDTAMSTFREICRIEVEDGIAFDPTSVKGSVIRKEAGYGGVRIDLQAKLDGARITLQVDIGFGDAVTPAPESMSYPVLLEGLPAPQLRTYPKYTVVAEKFHAVCLLGMANTRMKDYFDLWILLTDDGLDITELRRAVEATFDRRKLAIPSKIPAGLSDAFVQDAAKQRQWAAFLKKNRLDALDLTMIVVRLRSEFQKLGLSN